MNEQEGGREGELFKKLPENNDFVQKITTFFASQKNVKFLRKCLKTYYFSSQGGATYF